MAYSYSEYIGDGQQTVFTFSFPYLAKEHVKAYVNNVGATFKWINASTVRLDFAAAQGALITIKRETPLDLRVDFTDGSTLRARELDYVYLQNLYIAQERQDTLDQLIGKTKLRIAGESGVIISDPEEFVDAMAQEILQSRLMDELQQSIGDIRTNSESILQQNVNLDSIKAQVDSLSNINGEGLSTFLENEQTARIEADQALQAALDTLDSNVDAAITQEQTARVQEDVALAGRIDALAVQSGENAAAITQEQTARADADAAIAEQLDVLGALSDDGQAFDLNQSRVRVLDNDGEPIALGTRLSSLQASIGENSAAITSEATARANEIGSLARELHLLGAQSEDGATFVMNEDAVFLSDDISLAARLSGLQASIGESFAAIQQESSVRADAIGGLEAQLTVKIDINGYAVGWGMAATEVDGVPSSAFVLRTDSFKIVDPLHGLATPIEPFVIDNGIVKMPHVEIGDANIKELTVGKLKSGTLDAAINVGTGRIVFDNGSHMKVQGVGFGTTGQFIEWFGPRQSNINNCSEGNATYYLKTNGDAYFGGNLHAGVLHNSVQSTSLSTSAEVLLGPYSSNGGSKKIILSFSCGNQAAGSGYSEIETSGSYADVRLERRIGSGSWTTVTTRRFTGGVSSLYIDNGGEPGVPTHYYSEAVSGSFTLTDTTSPTSDRSYRAVLIDRNTAYSVKYQTLAISSTEE